MMSQALGYVLAEPGVLATVAVMELCKTKLSHLHVVTNIRLLTVYSN